MITTLLLMSGLASALTPIAPPKPSPAQTALYNALKVRHESPLCSELADLSASVANDLVWLINNAKQPPWVGIRAAQCVVQHHTDTQADIIDTWVTNPQYKGLALLTFGLLDELPEPAAVRFATLGLEGPMAEDARKRLVDSAHPTISNLAKQHGELPQGGEEPPAEASDGETAPVTE